MPGSYTVTVSQRVLGTESVLAGPETFTTRLLGNNTQMTDDFAASLAFQQEAAELYRAVQGASRTMRNATDRLAHIRQAINDTPALDRGLLDTVDALDARLADLGVTMWGDRTISRRSEPVTPGLSGRLSRVMWGTRDITSAPTLTQQQSFKVAAGQFGPLLADVTSIVETDIRQLEDTLEQAGAPYTPGRIPQWQEN